MSAPLFQGVAVGAFLVTALAIWRSGPARHGRFVTILACTSAAAWVLAEAGRPATLVGLPDLIVWLAFPAAGLFRAFVGCVFLDRPLRWPALAPAAVLAVWGVATTFASTGSKAVWLVGFNTAATAICLHAVFLIVQSWRGDLVDSRRASRIVILGGAALFAAAQGAAGALRWLDRDGVWTALAVGDAMCAIIVSILALAIGCILLQSQTGLFAASGPPGEDAPAPRDPKASVPSDPASSARLMAMDRILFARLEAFMDAEGWRQEGLGITAPARELGAQEHRLRRLINARLGYRNFADFLNRYRIEAAKACLEDPAQAQVTVASIAFDLGFGSLSPFNRAFRAATGSTPTEWRNAVLAKQALVNED